MSFSQRYPEGSQAPEATGLISFLWRKRVGQQEETKARLPLSSLDPVLGVRGGGTEPPAPPQFLCGRKVRPHLPQPWAASAASGSAGALPGGPGHGPPPQLLFSYRDQQQRPCCVLWHITLPETIPVEKMATIMHKYTLRVGFFFPSLPSDGDSFYLHPGATTSIFMAENHAQSRLGSS